jgi:hypothetical protein
MTPLTSLINIRPPVESRNLIVTVPVQSPSEKFVATKNQPSCSFASSRMFPTPPSPSISVTNNVVSNVSSGKSHKTSKPIYDSSLVLLALCRKLSKHTSSHCSKTPICVLSMANVSLFNPRICNLLVVSVESARNMSVYGEGVLYFL